MLPNVLRAAALFLCSCQAVSVDATPTLWAESPLGACFSNRDVLLESLYGAGYTDDENIVISKAHFESGPDRYDWITDATPKINQTKYLARTSQKDSCIILFAPSVTAIDLSPLSLNSVPERITTLDAPGPGFRTTKIIYQYDSRKRLYAPVACFAFLLGNEPAPLPCSDVYANR